MIYIGQACFVLNEEVCVVWDSTFNFWEFIATVIATGVVTLLTIYWSVRISREATTAQLVAADNAARLAREERAALAETERVRVSIEARTRLAQAMIRVAHQLEDSVDSKPRSEARRAAVAEWAALRVAFETSAEPNAADLYEFADMTIKRAMEPPAKAADPGQSAPDFIAQLLRKQFSGDLAAIARRWVADPNNHPDPVKLSVLREQWGAEQKVKSEQFMKAVEELLRQPRTNRRSRHL